MGADSSKHQVFGGNLSELYDADATQPVPFIINVCLKYLAHVKLQHELEMTGLEKALVSVGFVNEDDTPRSAVQTPLRQIRHGTGGIPSRTNSVASPSLRALHRKTSKTMSLVRPHKKLRTLLRLTKKSLNQGRHCNSLTNLVLRSCQYCSLGCHPLARPRESNGDDCCLCFFRTCVATTRALASWPFGIHAGCISASCCVLDVRFMRVHA